ncbi:hypothetical protein B0H14DRAFT_3516812 [Mycena olivaceomarginata]|nr:hypothetical protein B0H14DRAFT_3516812 [Mycena olivaceomarginata]
MRFLAHAHLVALGLLSLGITAYAQQCSQDTDCADNECCGLGGMMSGVLRCTPRSGEGIFCGCGCAQGLVCRDIDGDSEGECVRAPPTPSTGGADAIEQVGEGQGV